MPKGDTIVLDDSHKTWKKEGVELILPPATYGGESIQVSAVKDVFRSEITQIDRGYYLSLHPLRHLPLIQIQRPSTDARAELRVRMDIKKPRLTRNTFIVNADSLECLVGREECRDVSFMTSHEVVVESQYREQADGFWHRKGRVEFATNQTGVFFLAILTGFRDVNQPSSATPDEVAPTDGSVNCEVWASTPKKWDRSVACVQWAACDDSKKNSSCVSLRCNCLSLAGDVAGCQRTRCCGDCR